MNSVNSIPLSVAARLSDLISESGLLGQNDILLAVGFNRVEGNRSLAWFVVRIYFDEFKDAVEVKMKRPLKLLISGDDAFLSSTVSDLVFSLTSSIIAKRVTAQGLTKNHG